MFTITSIVIVTLIKNVGKPTFIFTDFLHFILPFTNFIFDITNSNINKVDLFSQLTKIYNSKTTDWVDKVIVKDRENVLVIFKKRPAATLRVTTSQM